MDDASASCDAATTFFAPAGRDAPEEFARKVQLVRSSPLLTAVLNAMPGMVMVLNANRQVVAANQAMLRVLEQTEHDVLQKRPGEVVGCVRPAEGPDGCGTSRHCVTCGAVLAVRESQTQNVQVVRECRIVIQDESGPGALDLRVAATPLEVEGERFLVVAVDDISKPKRMAVFQRVFFHDVLNTAGCISGYADYLTQDEAAVHEVSESLVQLSGQLVEEILAQRDLVWAESGDLAVQIDMLTIGQTLDDLRTQYRRSPVAADQNIELGTVVNAVFWTDRRLVMRVLGNMLKNALEATGPGETVTLGGCDQGDEVVFSVHNPGVMPDDVQLQLFQRSFSTKGQPGRGVGSYSMKLLGERYLHGRVEFLSRDPEGTTFTLRLPKSPPA